MDLQKINILQIQPLQRRIHGVENVFAREAEFVDVAICFSIFNA